MSTASAPPTEQEQEHPPQVALVTMPYAALSRPSMALGLLKAILVEAGIPTSVEYASLWFAEFAGLDLYQLCATYSPTDLLLGEWTFAASAFPEVAVGEREALDEEYLEHLAHSGRLSRYQDGDGERLKRDMRALRAHVAEFVDTAAKRVLETGVRIVGCTSTFQQHTASLALLRRVKELDPEVITLLGGANCEAVMGQTTHRLFPWVDYLVSGEADGIVAPLCRRILEEGRNIDPRHLPPGVLGPRHREDVDGRRRLPVPLHRAMFHNLDSLPVPEFSDYFSLLGTSSLSPDIKPGLPLETSRGCWWGDKHQCTFCGLNGNGMSFRSKSADRVLGEIRELEARHGIGDFEVVDNILEMDYFKTVLPALAEEGRGRNLFYEVKANLSRKQIETLIAAGVIWVQPGIESLHSEVLRLMDKGVSAWQNIQLLKNARELGLRLSWNLLWGFPGELDEYYVQMAEWIPPLEHLQPPASVFRLRYDRFSVYHQQARSTGLQLAAVPAMAYVYPHTEAELENLAYFFVDGQHHPQHRPFDDGAVEMEDRPGVQAVQTATRHWLRSFNARSTPLLSVKEHRGLLDVIDTRSCARALRHRLGGLDRAVYEACERAPRPAQIAATVRTSLDPGVTDAEVDEAIARLTEAKLVLPIDGRLLALGLREPVAAFPSSSQFPGGNVNGRKTVDAEPPSTLTREWDGDDA